MMLLAGVVLTILAVSMIAGLSNMSSVHDSGNGIGLIVLTTVFWGVVYLVVTYG